MKFVRISLAYASGLALATMLSATAAQAGDIIGTVTDNTQTRGLQGTQLRVTELDRVVEAGRDGSFRFINLPAGTYTVEASYIGTEATRTKVTVPESGHVTTTVSLGAAGDIIVIGQAASLASSLTRQRAADGVESVLTRDAIGQFPDQNVAEALRRLPGVNILNDQGEGRFVSIRGLDPELNSSAINGVRVPSPEGETRSVALDVIPSELIESIEVKKSLTPDMDGDTLGASIEINTTSAFDRKKDLLNFKLEGSYNDYADALTPKGSFDFSKRISDNFGIAGGFSYYLRRFETDNIEAADWALDKSIGIVSAKELQYRDYDVERERVGGTLSFDWRVSDTTKLYARGLYSEFSDQEYRGDLTFIMSGAPKSGTETSAYFEDQDGRIEVRRRMKDRFEKQKIGSVTLGGETLTGPWKLSYSAAWAEANERENGSVDPTRFRARFNNNGVNVGFDYSNPEKPLFDVTGNTALFNDPTTYAFNELEETRLSLSKDREYTLRGDVAREFAAANGTFTVQTGVKSRWREKSHNFEAMVYGGFDGDYTLADVLGGQTYRITDLGPLPSHQGPTGFFQDNRNQFELNTLDTAVNSAAADYAIDEDVLAGYLLGRWENSSLRAIAGVRYERTRNDIRGNLVASDGDVATITPQQFKRSYSDWLPSVTMRYEPVRNLVLRFGGYKSLMRPKLSNLAPRFMVNEDEEAEFGNPHLKPYRAWNMDASAEWYFGNNAALTAGFFWKDIENFVVKQRDENSGEAFGTKYDKAVTFTNGPSAKIKGVELSYAQRFTFLPSPLDGLLLNANYTYTDAKGTVLTDGDITLPRRISLPASSKHTFNAVLGYEKGPVSLRAAGTYRSKYLDELGDAADTDRMVAGQFQLDLSAKLAVTPGVKLFAEWINVTDAPYFAYQNYAGSRRLLQYEEYNWTAKFGVTASF